MGRIEEKKKEKNEETSEKYENLKSLALFMFLGIIFGTIFYFAVMSITAPNSPNLQNFTYNTSETTVIENKQHPNIIGQNANKTEVTKVEYFGDYRCPHCHSFDSNNMQKLINEYVKTGEIVLYYRPYPVVDGVSSYQSRYAYTFWDQNPDNYWSRHANLVEIFNEPQNTDELNNSLKNEISESQEAIHNINNNSYKEKIRLNTAKAQKHNISATPSFLVNDEQVILGNNYEKLSEAIENHSK